MYQFALRLCSSLKRKRITRSSLLLLYLATSCFTASLAAQQIITIDYPGAVSTSPGAINNAGKVTGAYFDGTAYHGFLRNGDGTFVSFDPPGSTSTGPDSINSVGEITGLFQDASGHTLGFIRAIGGRFTIFDATDGGLYSYPLCISNLGEVSGDTTDSGGRSHGFIREGDGTITLFDPPNPSIFSDGAYYVNNGSVVGTYFDGSITADEHGYIRDAEGRYTIIDAPGATSRNSGLGTEAWKMNSSGTVIGDYWDYNLHRHGFTRDAQGDR